MARRTTRDLQYGIDVQERIIALYTAIVAEDEQAGRDTTQQRLILANAKRFRQRALDDISASNAAA